MSIGRVTGKRDTLALAVLCLVAFLAGALAGCQDQASTSTLTSPANASPSLPSPDETPTQMPSSSLTPTATLSAEQAREAAAEWLRANAVPFETTEPGSKFEDLLPLKELIGDARIVALGEATHGTHEFFQMKHRLVEFLVEEIGFSLFAMEAGWAEADSINDYVHTCEGDPATALAGLGYWTWNTREVLDMIQWMCIHNQKPGDTPEIGFAGFDMQLPDTAITNVISYFQRVEPSYVEVATDRYSCLRWRSGANYAGLPDMDQAVCRSALQEVLDHLVAEREAYEEISSPEEFTAAEQSARMVLQAEDVLADETPSVDRDRYMAENVVRLLEQAGPDARIILWAHNGHVADRAVPEENWKSMGSYLREVYREDLVVVGFAFDHGQFNAIGYNSKTNQYEGLRIFETSPTPPGSYEWYFRSAEIPRMILDLRDVSGPSPTTDWLMGPHPLRSAGAIHYNDDSYTYMETSLPEEFDIIIYFEETTPSTLLVSQ